MSVTAQVQLLACIVALVLGCRAELLIGRQCPGGDCDPAALRADAAAVCGAEFELAPTVAVANEELHRCQLFTLDALQNAAGSDHVYITKAVATMMPYGHEIDVRIAPEIANFADGPVDCGAILDQPVTWVPLITSLGESAEWDFGSTPLTAARSQRLLIAERFANPSSEPITVAVTLKLDCASTPPAQPSQIFEFVDVAARSVGPAAQLTVTADCRFTRKVSVWRLFRPPQRISTFAAYRDHQTQPFWNSDTEWSIDVAPPLNLNDGDGFAWRCDYQNLGDTSFDVGGVSGYACALRGIYYQPPEDGDAEPLRCEH
jgi:hypothetical protein